MGWNDRDYNPGREEMRGYMANPAGMLAYALPIWKSPGLQVRLSFWFLLSALFLAIWDIRLLRPEFIPMDLGLFFGLCLWHELGHRIFAQRVGGNHWEWVLSCFGGQVAPTCPSTPWAVFMANVGGVVFNSGIQLLLIVGAIATGGGVLWSKVMLLPLFPTPVFGIGNDWFLHAVTVITLVNMTIVLMNLFPTVVFDGGRIWTAILWPKMGSWRALRLVCLVGMILCVPLLLMSVWATDLLGIVFWALIFAANFRTRQQLEAAGPGVMDDDGPSYNYMDTDKPRARKNSLRKKWLGSALRKKARAEQAEQAKIDAILAKVKVQGLHSLTWWERRTLKKATERQRQQDLAERL